MLEIFTYTKAQQSAAESTTQPMRLIDCLKPGTYYLLTKPDIFNLLTTVNLSRSASSERSVCGPVSLARFGLIPDPLHSRLP
jgi:hypothetical protein